MSSDAISLPPQMFTDEAVALREALLGASGPAISVDASAVSFAGTAALQVILAAARSARRDGRELKIINPSDGWTESLERLGLGQEDFEAEVALQ